MSVLSEVNAQQVENLLVEDAILAPEELANLKAEATELKEPILAYLVKQNKISQEDLTRYSAKVLGVSYIDLREQKIDIEVLKLIPKEIAERNMAVAVGEGESRLIVAMLDAENIQAADFISNQIGRPITVNMASEESIRHVIAQYEADVAENVEEAIDEHTQAVEEEKASKTKSGEDVITIATDSPISRALNAILEYAAKVGASDVHVEPMEDSLKIRTRVDGSLREVMKLPKTSEPAFVSRIKILSNLKIDEHRIPQDGQFTVKVADREIDLRIATSPTVWGEQVVIRLLDKTGTSLKLTDLGYTGHALRTVRDGIARPNGMVLTSGPTGSGKSTSMYALLQEIKNDKINIVTLEDPVEYKIEGVNQIQVNPDVGLTFASGLRSVLRQDPDVVMVGEIRDRETANLAVQAALTGHLVLSTLHTNSAAGVLPRLLDMGIEPFLIAATVNTVIAQRLVRRLANDKQPYQSSHGEVESIHSTLGELLPKSEQEVAEVAKDLGYQTLPLATQNAYTLYSGTDAPEHPDGYKGRMGLYEAFSVSEAIEELILNRATANQVQRRAQEEGMLTMREDGYLKALAGLTTIKEVNRVAATGNL